MAQHNAHRNQAIECIATLLWSIGNHATKWMVSEAQRVGSERRIKSMTFSQFKRFFRIGHAADVMWAKRFCDNRDNLVDKVPSSGEKGGPMMSVAIVSFKGKRRVRTKAFNGRGRKCEKWLTDLEAGLVEKFDCIRKLGVKFSAPLIGVIAPDMIQRSREGSYRFDCRYGKANKLIDELVNNSWVQRFLFRNNFVVRRQTGTLQLSPAVLPMIEKLAAFIIGQVVREIQSGSLNDNEIENGDETHFMMKMDDGRTLRICGDEQVKYADVLSGGDGMTMLVRITGGEKSLIANPLMILKNKDCNYPIRSVEDNVNGVLYRTGTKRWIDKRVMTSWAQESRALLTLTLGWRRAKYMDNFSGHDPTEYLKVTLLKVNTEIRFDLLMQLICCSIPTPSSSKK